MKSICTLCALALASSLLLVSGEDKKDEKADKKRCRNCNRYRSWNDVFLVSTHQFVEPVPMYPCPEYLVRQILRDLQSCQTVSQWF